MLRRLDSHRPGVPRHFPAAFTSTEAYCAKLREVRGALIESEKAGVDHFIYVIRESGYGASELMKIGYSASPANRLQTMQVCTPRKLEIAFTTRCPGPRYDRVIHSILPPKDRRTGEWYLLSPWSWWALEFVFDAEKRHELPAELAKHAEKAGETISLGS